MNTNQHAIMNSTAVNHGIVPDSYLITNDSGPVLIHDMDGAVILYVGTVPNCDFIHIPSNRYIEPNGTLSPDCYITDYISTWGDEYRLIKNRCFVQKFVYHIENLVLGGTKQGINQFDDQFLYI